HALVVATHFKAALLGVAQHFNPGRVGVQIGVGFAENISPRGSLANGKQLPFTLDASKGLPDPLGIACVADLLCAMDEASGVGLENSDSIDGLEKNITREQLIDCSCILPCLQ